jgi:hypothetical protein
MKMLLGVVGVLALQVSYDGVFIRDTLHNTRRRMCACCGGSSE